MTALEKKFSPNGKEKKQPSERLRKMLLTAGGRRGAAVLRGTGALYGRGLGLLEIRRRVLEEAHDPHGELLERVKFISIVGGNLDEFYVVRGGVKQ